MADFFQYSIDQLKKIRDDFVVELVRISQGKKSSLSFIKNSLPQKSFISNNKIFQVMVVGGRVFEKALVSFIHPKGGRTDSLRVKKIEKDVLPVFKTKENFFSFFFKQLNSQVNIVALNFAYHLDPLLRNGLIDGRLISGTKEHLFNNLINKLIGKELEDYIFTKEKRKINVSVANDTICLLLAALLSMRRSSSSHTIAAGIVGAGTNFAFFLNENTAVNLESGNFDKFPQTVTGKIINRNSLNPGRYLFEKEISGAYLYQHYNGKAKIKSTKELSLLADQGDFVAQKLFERSASLIACQIAGLYKFKKMKIENCKLKIVMEGSVFWDGWQYQRLVNNYLEKLDISKGSIEFIKINNSSLIGAAKLISIE